MAFALHAHARAAPRYAAPAGSRRCSARRAAPAAAPRRALTSQPRRIVLAAAAGGGDPFAASAPPPPPGAAPPAGFLASTEDRNRLLPTGEAETLLKRFDADCMAAQRAAARAGAGLAAAAPPPAATACTVPPLRAASVALASRSGSVMLGICAADTAAALAALKAWTTGLGLPRRLLHGLDLAGKPVTIDGPVFIKYNSASGDAFASGYGGDARGVLFTPGLPDGAFRQYGYLPLGLFDPAA